MPTYEYLCDACSHGFEAEQRITADPLRECPKCGKSALTRLVGTGNFILKGSGWYADAYSGGAAAAKPASDAAPSPSCGTCGQAPGSCQSN